MQKTKNITYSVEFKTAAVKQASESDLPVSETAKNLGINVNTLFTWFQKHSQPIEKTTLKYTDTAFIINSAIASQRYTKLKIPL